MPYTSPLSQLPHNKPAWMLKTYLSVLLGFWREKPELKKCLNLLIQGRTFLGIPENEKNNIPLWDILDRANEFISKR
jgi:hypothetical protein